MKNYEMSKIRNITLVGAPGAGKTMLCEILLNNAKSTTRIGRIEDGNTVMDFDAEEITRKMSIAMGLGYLEWNDHYFNLIDTPGYADFNGDQLTGLIAGDTALVVANAAGGFEVGLEMTLENLKNMDISKALLVNRMDNEHANYEKVISDIEENTDFSITPLIIPIGAEAKFSGVIDLIKEKAYIDGKEADIPADMQDEVSAMREQLMESVAETSEALMEKYFEDGELSSEEIVKGVRAGVSAGDIIPAFACSVSNNIGCNEVMTAIADYLPSPADKKEITVKVDDEAHTITADPNGELVAYIFKSFSDPNFGDVAYVKVLSGTLKQGLDVMVAEKSSKDRIGNMYHIQGKNRSDASELRAGEIGGLVKLKVAKGLNTLCATNKYYCVDGPVVPSAVYWKKISAASQADEDKIGGALQKLLDEDITAHAEINVETKENILSGIGEQQLMLIQKRLKSRYKVEANLSEPRIPYKETINGKAECEYKHKKQSGGRGQYGHVLFRIGPKPRGEGFEFINGIVGGVIPSKFIPAIEKGLKEIMEKGVVAGYKVVDLFVECYYGSYHDVDSSEMAFKIAASRALKQGFQIAKPVLLEPIYDVQIIIPNEYMGDVMGDISTRRGRINGMEQVGNKQILNATVPLSELFEYFPILKSLTQGRGRFEQKFSHYEKLPDELAKKVIAEYESEE